MSLKIPKPHIPVCVALELIIIVAMAFATMIVWYVAQPMAIKIIIDSQAVTQDLQVNTTGSDRTYTLLKYAVFFSGPFLTLVLLLFAVVVAQRRDWRGYYD